MAEEKKIVKPTHYPPYERKGKRRTAPARANSACASQFFPCSVPSRFEQRGFFAQKDMTDRIPVHERLEKGIEWIKTKFKIVFVPREDVSDPDDMECLGVTQSAISDFTVDNWIYSVFAGVAELPYICYPFNSKCLSAERTGETKARFDAAVLEFSRLFYAVKKEMKKRVENDAYFLNSQFRSHTIWFLEKFFSQDLTPPEVVEDSKVEFEVLLPPPLPKEVEIALSNK